MLHGKSNSNPYPLGAPNIPSARTFGGRQSLGEDIREPITRTGDLLHQGWAIQAPLVKRARIAIFLDWTILSRHTRTLTMPQRPIMTPVLIASKESNDEKISCLISGACLSDRRLEENPTGAEKGSRRKDAA